VDTIEERIADWRTAVGLAAPTDGEHPDGLERELRGELAGLEAIGLRDDEAWLLAVRRVHERARTATDAASAPDEQLWRLLVAPDDGSTPGPDSGSTRDADVPTGGAYRWRDALLLAIAAALVAQLARLSAGLPEDGPTWLLRSASLLVLPFLAAELARAGERTGRQLAGIAGAFVAAALVINLLPFDPGGSTTELLAAAHLPIVLWAVVGYAAVGGRLRSPAGRMAFVRFSGSWFVTLVLFALGGGVLVGLTLALLAPTGLVDADQLIPWVAPSGAAGAVVIAAWLVGARPHIVGAVAPMLATVFTPLFALMLVVVTAVYAVTGLGGAFDRELLATFDALLVVVVGLVLYSLAARDPSRPATWPDRILLVTVLAALVLDLLVLGSMAARIGDLGPTPNRIAALGLNLVLLGNLAGTAWYGLRFVRGRSDVGPLLRWQTTYLPVFPAWAAIVVIVLPLVFAGA
jgi:hypothetical protein